MSAWPSRRVIITAGSNAQAPTFAASPGISVYRSRFGHWRAVPPADYHFMPAGAERRDAAISAYVAADAGSTASSAAATSSRAGEQRSADSRADGRPAWR